MRRSSLAAALCLLTPIAVSAAEAAESSATEHAFDSEEEAQVPRWRRFRLLLGASGVADVMGRGVGPSVSASLGHQSFEIATRVMIGTRVGVGAEASFTLLRDGLAPRVGARFTVFPGAAAFGGGPVVALRYPFGDRLSAFVDAGAEWFSATSAHRSFALTVGAGIELDLVGS